jgi:outer membrane biosynthesis protein TonB
MSLSARSAAFLLPLVLTGCFIHKNQQAKNPPVAPSTGSSANIKTEPVDLPPTATSIPSKPTETAKAPTPTQATPKPQPRRKTAQQAQQQPKQEVASVAAPPAPAAVSAIGQLSSGDPSNHRQETEDSLVSIEKTLNGINRPLSDAEQKTADHIREFLKEAREALTSGDVDGAYNLAAKAKVLLQELTQ